MSTQRTRAKGNPGLAFALVAGAALTIGVACTNTPAPVAAPPAELAKPQLAQSGAVSAPADNPTSPGGTTHWLGSASAAVAVEEYGDFQ